LLARRLRRRAPQSRSSHCSLPRETLPLVQPLWRWWRWRGGGGTAPRPGCGARLGFWSCWRCGKPGVKMDALHTAVRRVSGLDSLGADLRLALRQLRRAPGFTVTVVLTLALGIGATTAVFTLFDAVLLKALPVQRAEELYRVGD